MKFFQKENFGLDCGVECGLHSKNIVGVTRGLHSKNCIGLECGLHSKSSGVCNALIRWHYIVMRVYAVYTHLVL